MKKSILTILLSCVTALSVSCLAECGGDDGDGNSQSNLSSTESSTSYSTESSASQDLSPSDSSSSSGNTSDSTSSDSTTSSSDSTSSESTSSESTSSSGDLKEDILTATEILDELLNRPDPWSFLPDGLQPENMAYSTTPANDYTDFVNVSNIASNYIGQELSVIYNGLNYAESALTAANVIFTAGEAIGSVYQSYIDDNTDDYTEFTGSVTLGGSEYSVKITIDGSVYTLLMGNSTINVELSTDGETDTGRIQITNGVVLKYQSSQTVLRVAITFSATLLGYTGIFTQDMTFVRSGDAILGYLYEYLGTEESSGTDLARAYYYSDSNYTVVMSDAKDSGSSLNVDAYLEAYNSTTGKMIGAEVTESLATASYDTFWFNLYDVTGITSVKVTDEENANNDRNANSVYLNGSLSALECEWNTKLTIKTSRRYDVEMKTVSYVVSDGEGGYTIVEQDIPMLFVQSDELSDFSSDIVSNNPDTFTTNPALPDYSVVSFYFSQLEASYEELSENYDYTSTIAFIGSKNSFFE